MVIALQNGNYEEINLISTYNRKPSIMTNVPIIELQGISFSFSPDSPLILKSLDFKISEGKIGLIGPNGCGKTTLFHIIMGLLRPTAGKILHNGTHVRSSDEFKPLRRDIGFLFQSSDDQLFSPTVLEDVAFGPINLGHSVNEARQIAESTLEKLGMHGFEERITHKLSGGEKKLVALATILAMEPKLLLLDEPTNNLDLDILAHLTDILNELQLPFVIISHDWDFLAEITTALYTLENGQMLKCKEDHIHEHRHVHPYGDRPHHHNE